MTASYRFYLVTVILLATPFILIAQVGINADGSSPDGSAILDLKSSNKGFLLPRISIIQAFSIPSPAAGLMVYNTTNNRPIYFDGTSWKNLDGTPCTISIGDVLDGGTVFFLDSTGKSGLIAAPYDLTGTYSSGCFLYETQRNGVGSGYQNTLDKRYKCTNSGNDAAVACYDHSMNGFNDWFLPSRDELNLMYQNLKAQGLGNFSDNYYWSSSSVWICSNSPAMQSVWAQNFTNGSQASFLTYNFQFKVRPVRSFGPSSQPSLSFLKPESFSDHAILYVSIQPNGVPTQVYFQFGASPSYGDSIPIVQDVLDGTENLVVNAQVNGLSLGSLYHFRAVASNSQGITVGPDQTFIAYFGIGESFEGGTIFYVDSTWIHGMVTTSTTVTYSNWGCSGTEIIGANETSIGSGNQNTQLIVNNCAETDCAARYCSDLVVNGYDDWYLPSRDELECLIRNLYSEGDFVSLWSSSQVGENQAWAYLMAPGFTCLKMATVLKNYNSTSGPWIKSRAVRTY